MKFLFTDRHEKLQNWLAKGSLATNTQEWLNKIARLSNAGLETRISMWKRWYET